jgi:type II secretory pathway component PulF
MPFYLYSAVDNAGRKLEGTIQAGTPNEAMQLLAQRGFRAPRILAERAPQTQAATQPQPVIQQGQPLKINTPTAPPPAQIRRSRKSSDRELYFLFAQISDQLRAGIGPAQIFGELSQMYKAQKFRESLAMISQAAMEGKQISSVMALWPDLYPEHIVGLPKRPPRYPNRRSAPTNSSGFTGGYGLSVSMGCCRFPSHS